MGDKDRTRSDLWMETERHKDVVEGTRKAMFQLQIRKLTASVAAPLLPKKQN